MEQIYTPIADSLGWSTVAAALPILVLLLMIGVLRKPAWISALTGLAVGFVVAVAVYSMPAGTAVSATAMGAAFGWFPIGWIVFWAVVLYRLTVETGQFEIIKDSIGGITTDRRLQAMLIAFALGAFIEGAAGFGTPVAVAAAMMTGLGFSPFFAAGICLLANTAPVAFGSIGIPSRRSPVSRASKNSCSAPGSTALRPGIGLYSGLSRPGHGRLQGAQRCDPGRGCLRRLFCWHAALYVVPVRSATR